MSPGPSRGREADAFRDLRDRDPHSRIPGLASARPRSGRLQGSARSGSAPRGFRSLAKKIAQRRISEAVGVVCAEADSVQRPARQLETPGEHGASGKCSAAPGCRRGLGELERCEPTGCYEALSHDALGSRPDERVVKRNSGIRQQKGFPDVEVLAGALVGMITVDPEEGDRPRPGPCRVSRRGHDDLDVWCEPGPVEVLAQRQLRRVLRRGAGAFRSGDRQRTPMHLDLPQLPPRARSWTSRASSRSR